MKKQEKTRENTEKHAEKRDKVCPICGSNQIHDTGRCSTCYSCGWSACSM